MPKLFYGWLVVAGAFTVLATCYALQFSYGVLIPHMAAELGWRRSTFSAPFSLYILLYTWLSYFAGALTDRIGPRVVIACGALGLGLGYALLGTIDALWQPYVYLCAIAALGMSVAFVPCNATVIRWFVRKRGLALAIASAGISAAAVIGPLVTTALLETFSWRQTFQFLGAGAVALLLAASFVMVRDPETKNLRPDGDPSPDVSGAPVRCATGLEGVTLAQAKQSPAFWLLMAALFFTWLAVFFPFVHLPGHAVQRGIGASQAANLLVMLGVGGLLGRLLGGGLTDRLGRKPGLAISIALQAVAFLGLGESQQYVPLAVWAFVLGMGYSGVSVLFPALLGDLFGRAHVGAIVGFVFATVGGAAAAGPYLAGLVFDATGSFDFAFRIAVVLNTIALLLLLMLKNERRSDGSSATAP